MTTFFQFSAVEVYGLYADSGHESRQRKRTACPATPEHKASSVRVGPLHQFVNHNDREQKIIWGLDNAIHQDVMEQFERQKFTGFRTCPAQVTFADGGTSDSYREFVVTGWGGVAQPESGVHVCEECPGCKWKLYGGVTDWDRVIDPKQWQGEDFFVVWPFVTHIFCTARVADWLRASGLKSFTIGTPFAKEKRRPHITDSVYPRVALSQYFPQDLAIKYGRPLGIE